MPSKLPVYTIGTFDKHDHGEFYANYLKPHVASHAFTNLPHKHDFYLVMLVTKGSGIHEIDFVKYKVSPGFLFMMKPGQMHFWKLSEDIDGFVFFHTKTFFEKEFASLRLQDYPFYGSYQNVPYQKTVSKQLSELKILMSGMVEEYRNDQLLKEQRLHALVNLVYINMSRYFRQDKTIASRSYLEKAYQFEALIDRHYKKIKSAADYASMLNITEKHLNRICRTCFNKTSTQLIAERLVLEAKRMLMHTGMQVTQIAYELGFNDKSYFVRFFKKNSGETPLTFLSHYTNRK